MKTRGLLDSLEKQGGIGIRFDRIALFDMCVTQVNRKMDAK